MANVKITDLSALTSPASTDVLAIVDVAADVTKKVTIADLLENAGDGTAAAPAFSFDSDNNTGLFLAAADKLGFSTNGVNRIYIDGTGKVEVLGTLEVTGATTFANNVTVDGNLTVNGTTTTIDSATLVVEDKNIEMGAVTTPTDVTADGGGITLKGTTDKTINWVNSTDAWTLSEHVNIASAKEYRINGTKVLDATSLGSAVVSSSLTSVGTIGTGVWNGTPITTAYIADSSVTSAKIANGTIVDADVNASAAIGLSKLATGSLPTGITIASANIVDGTIVDTDINASAAIGLSKLATGTLPTGITVASANIVDGTIVDADINASAAIGLSKLATGALPTGITVASANIANGTIVDADISATAEIAVSKLANGTARQLLQTDAAGTGVEFTSNVDVPGTLDVTGAATFDSTARFIGNVTVDGSIIFEGATADDYELTLSAADPTADVTVTIPASTTTLAGLAVAQSFTKAQRGTPVTLTDAATVAVDLSLGNNFALTIAGNRTLGAPTNVTAGQSGVIVVTQDGTGSRTLAYNSVYKFAGGTAPTLTTTANAVDVLAYYVESATRITVTSLLNVS